MTDSEHHSQLTRRSVLGKALGLGAVATVGVTTLTATSASAGPVWVQYRWYYCRWCATLVNLDWYEHGCPGRGTHWRIGWTFQLSYNETGDAVGSPHHQTEWRHCNRCMALYFNGYSSKGVCRGSNGGPHINNGLYGAKNYIIPHDLANPAGAQPNWAFCHRCFVMFYNGDSFKGVCAAGGGHSALGFNFAIPVHSYS